MAALRFETLPELLEAGTTAYSGKPAIGTKVRDGFSWVTYRELHGLVAEARGGLAARGVTKGDRVAIVSDNRLEWVVLAFATFSLGAVYVPMYEAQLPAEWEFILRDAGAKVAVGATDRIVEALGGMKGRIPGLEVVIGLAQPPRQHSSYSALLEEGRQRPAPPANVSPDDLASLIYTSGTTGDPKGVCLTHDNIASNVRGALQRFHFLEDDRSLAFLPWAHVFGQTCELYSLLGAGASLALNDEIPRLIENLSVVRPTVLVAVPRIFNRIYDGVNKQMADKPAVVQKLFASALEISARKRRGQSVRRRERLLLRLADKVLFSRVRQKFGGRLRFVVSGSAALSPVVAEFIDALGIDVFEGYGLSETSPVVSANYPGHRKIGTVGPPFPGVRVRIDTDVTGDSHQGEIVVYGRSVMKGYYRREEETTKVFTEDGGFRTGDMGLVDDEGFLKITGRIKEQYKLENGKYVVPSPLEEELKLSPFIANVMIHGANKPHNVALVVADAAALRKWAEERGAPLVDTASPAVERLLMDEIEKYSADFKGYERVKKIAVIAEDFTTENGLLTPKMSLKRHKVVERYAPLLEKLYAG